MPLPSPRGDESQDDFISRCMSDETAMNDFPDQEQRSAVCFDQWREAKNNSEMFTFRASLGQLRTEQFQGREHLVVPVVALAEGVLRPMNSDQPELALAQEFVPTAPAWNGKPVVVNHPMKNGQPVSANSPDIWEQDVIGHIFNSEAENQKLKFEAWIDRAKANEIGGTTKETVDALADGQMMEVSTGLFAKTEPQSGTHEGKKFNGVWRDILPDHIAILEQGSVGACSIEDGCGAPRMNQCGCENGNCACKGNTMTQDSETEPEQKDNALKRAMKSLSHLFTGGRMNDITRREALQQAAQHKGIDGMVMAVEDDGSFIMEEFSEDGLRTVRRSFKIEGGRVEIGDDPVPVRMEQTFTRVRTNEDVQMAKEDLVNNLISNTQTHFEEGDRELLMKFDENKLQGMQPTEEEPKDNSRQEPIETPDFNTLLQKADPETRESFEQGMKMFKQRKSELINHIKGCQRNKFTDEQLQSKSYDELEQIAALVEEPAVDYSVRGAPINNTEDPTAPPKPKEMFPRKENQ